MTILSVLHLLFTCLQVCSFVAFLAATVKNSYSYPYIGIGMGMLTVISNGLGVLLYDPQEDAVFAVLSRGLFFLGVVLVGMMIIVLALRDAKQDAEEDEQDDQEPEEEPEPPAQRDLKPRPDTAPAPGVV